MAFFVYRIKMASLDKLTSKTQLARFFKNKYVLASTVFFIWIGFIDENSLLQRLEFEKELNQLQNDKDYFQNKIKTDTYEMEALDKDENLERIAREKYLMKTNDEDIFVIEQK